MSHVDQTVEHIRANHPASLEQLTELLALPSISTLPEHRNDVRRTAEWLKARLDAVGMERTAIMDTPGHPVVYAEWLGAPGEPVLLVYGHYDVQPADPIEEWSADPFSATTRGDVLIARGASDMKGQLSAFLSALQSIAACGSFPVNLKLLFEGEEEVGSPHLADFIAAHQDMLASDAVLNCDGGIQAPDLPAITYALRGLAYFELEVRGPGRDLHSGLFGGSIHNPLQALCELIAGMHDAEGRVTLPGFYESVPELSAEEREALAQLPYDDAEWLEMTGAPALWGEKGYTTIERIGARPTLEVNGIIGGFTGEGSKTVLPAKASAKISMRLVPGQDSGAIHDQLCAYLREHAPDTVTWELREHVHANGAIMNRNSPAMRTAVKALKDVFGTDPVFRREGGTIPVVNLLQEQLGADTVMLGFSLPGDGIHGPDERLHLPTFYRGIETYARFLFGLAGQNGGGQTG